MAGSRTFVYIDGFNLYYGSLRGTKLKWLNIESLCQMYLQHHDIRKIYYFTARVSASVSGPDQPLRQQLYIRALKTLKTVEIIDGHFLVERLWLPKADGTGRVEVIRPKEKKSDVNLASALLWDAHCNNFDTAVVISGDSDFETPVKMVKQYFRKPIGVLDPQRDGTPNSPLNQLATFYKPIRSGALAAAQFPNQLTDARGDFYKPGEWF